VLLQSTNKKWHQGWTLFVDNNNNGTLDNDDETLSVNNGLDAVITHAKAPMNGYVAFIGTGEGRQLGTGGIGGFLAGTIKICPKAEGDGYSLILSSLLTRIVTLSANI
jgi:type IV fimbrial biogenesis protein FimT